MFGYEPRAVWADLRRLLHRQTTTDSAHAGRPRTVQTHPPEGTMADQPHHTHHPADPTPPPYAQFRPYPGPAYGYAMPFAPATEPAGLAGLGARFGARLLDVILWYALYFIPAIPVMTWIDGGGGSTARTVLLAWLAVSFVLYFPFAVWKFGATLGKRVCGVRIVRRETAHPVGFWRALGRELFWLIAFIIPVLSLLNPLWCCWDKPYRQCLHDKTADTMVTNSSGRTE
ncbi:RDD family protein [Streptomyces scabiei]|uniref:RDD family protein n=2 Tax=Streptomyces scabiei TaxID=1930 RepID=A0A100JTK2_STRSC|nr:RDD family protein [Streptomyces scabiei]